MNHPNHDEWLAYLEGYTSREEKARLCAHLEQCPECTAQMSALRRTIQRLQKLPWPEPQPVRQARLFAPLKWAVAAAIILLLGFGVGRQTAPSPTKLKLEVLAEVREQLKADLIAATAPAYVRTLNGFQSQLRSNMQANLIAPGTTAAREQQQALNSFVQMVQNKQDENQRAVLLLLRNIEQQHTADYIALRKDLETAVSAADTDLQLNSQRLTRLAAAMWDKSSGN
jgi:hypothetical protein